ncbi:MAG: TrbI/VirB10 family protein [Pseudomonadota bacterium]|nr:TrbI/VirB10 family protein [Pseudomonadota bacterium]
MSDEPNPDLERRLAALEEGKGARSMSPKRRTPLLAVLIVLLILAGGAALLLVSGSNEEVALPTATPDEFQSEGDGFGEIEPFVPPPPPEPEIVLVEPDPTPAAEPDTALLAEIEALRAQIDALTAANEGTEDPASSEATDALTAQIADLEAASEAAQERFETSLAARDRELEQLRLDLELARLGPDVPTPGLSDEERRAREEEARRLAELERRSEEARAFQERRITSPLLAFSTTTTEGSDANQATGLGDVADFIRGGGATSEVTPSEIIANPSNAVVQGTMIQAVMETALDSTLPGPTRAIVSEDVYSYDGSQLLIPRGSRLIGRYQSGADIAQKRVTIAWDRLVLPSRQTIRLSAYGGDELGRSGVTGSVDTRFMARFGSAALISIISAVANIGASSLADEPLAEAGAEISAELQGATESVIGDYLSVGPVIHVPPGSRVSVMVDRDLEIYGS